MFTKKQKEKICEELYNWETSPYLTETWKKLSRQMKNKILTKMEPYLNNPANTAVLKRILTRFEPSDHAEFNKVLPHSIAVSWETEKPDCNIGTHMVVSPDKLSVSFYTDDEWAEYQKNLGK
jgi:hypothetical protein